ncbi:SpoIIE family protein phosphatase [Halioglobus pacificus]|uniref:IcfG protein n=1 Tax=Parahalioglobus pacificus TaxID=930806 RepID=A0A918XK99_9GAMM|nr:SpoIIE family protein phosphatase [Halioglobus pacificus]GHD34325.1 IcfG protein [Halioglobus pacificus]
MWGSITNRLILVISLTIGTIIAIDMAIDYRLSRDELLMRLQLESEETISGAVTDLETLLDSVESSTGFLATILAQREYSPEGLEQLLRDLVALNEDIFGSAIALSPGFADQSGGFAPYFFRRDGTIERANLAAQDENYQTKDWYLEPIAQGGPVWVEPYFDAGGAEVLMTTYSVPVYRSDTDGNRVLYAIVTADVALQELREYMKRLRLGEHGFGVLLSQQGTMLVTRDPANLMRSYKDAIRKPQVIAAFEAMIESTSSGRLAGDEIACAAIPGNCRARVGVLETTGWPIGIIYSQDEVLAPLREYQLRTALVSVSTLLIMALAVSLIARRLTAPLGMLAEASDQLAKGQLAAPLPPATGRDEVAKLVRSFSAMQRDLSQYITNLEEATASRSRLEGELAAAREIQMAMLPQGGSASEHQPGYTLWAWVRPAKTVGGDLYTFRAANNQLWLAVGDVSDKGVPAALFMARAISFIQQMGATAPDVALASLNDALTAGNDNCMFVTLFLGRLDLSSGELCFASGGHAAPIIGRGGIAQELEQTTGPALGLASDLTFPINTAQLTPGDRLVLYTDGIDESFDEHAEMFGEDRVIACIQEGLGLSAEAAGEQIFSTVDSFAGNAPQSDDITLMLVDFRGKHPGHQHQTTFTLNNDLNRNCTAWLEQRLEQAGVAPDVIMEMVLVQEELVTNVAKYSGLPASETVSIALEVGSAVLSLEISDAGKAFNPLTESERAELGADIDHARVGGLGVHLITQFTSSQRYSRENGRNVLRVTRNLPSA